MSDLDRVKAMLRRSARDGTAQAARVEYVTAPAGVARILEHVDTAVLGQRLEFAFDDGSRFACEASGRRLVRLLAPAPAGLMAEQVALFDRDELSVDAAGVLANLFVGLCERGAGLSITTVPLGEGAGPRRGGVDPGAIAEAAGLVGEAVPGMDEGTSHQAFLDALQPLLQAAIAVDGDGASLIHGEGDEAAFVADWVDGALERLLSPGFALLGTLETNGILVFGLPEAAGRHLLVAGRRGSFVVATVKGGDVAATLDAWRKCTLGRGD